MTSQCGAASGSERLSDGGRRRRCRRLLVTTQAWPWEMKAEPVRPRSPRTRQCHLMLVQCTGGLRAAAFGAGLRPGTEGRETAASGTPRGRGQTPGAEKTRLKVTRCGRCGKAPPGQPSEVCGPPFEASHGLYQVLGFLSIFLSYSQMISFYYYSFFKNLL